eukprot:TRINITY_DN40863_c0_g1_i1.p1 TRINITY_DN40863_c0_g1~~TRINITY_DN40863_c0_g1_i1.p1  ORF type:complete len:921 (+),score=127.33 TRINITY_DN40863_c0_g1_i1:97-2763(+)
MEIALTARGKVSEADALRLRSCFDLVAQFAPQFACGVAAWLRSKSELGNRLVSGLVLVEAAANSKTSPLVRGIAPKVFLLPTDLMEASTLFQELHKRPSPACFRKAGIDFFSRATPYQLAKYDVKGKIVHTKATVSECRKLLAELSAEEPCGRSAKLMHEERNKQLSKRLADAEARLAKLRKQDLGQLVARFHLKEPAELVLQLLGKRYPDDAESFKRTGLTGDFDPSRAGQRMHLPPIVTWDRELSETGNTPRTWHKLLKAKNESGYIVPYMALLRNLRNIILAGLPTSFLRQHVFSRLTDLRQIRGSGQTPTTLSNTRDLMLKEFSEERLADWVERSHGHLINIMAYYRLRARFTADIIGHSDKVSGVIGEFLGGPIWTICGLEYANGCFMARREMKIRGSKRTIERRCCIPLDPPTKELISELSQALESAAQKAAEFTVRPIDFHTTLPIVVCYDVSNPPLATTKALALDENETHMCGLKDVEVLNIGPGMQVTFSSITSHNKLCLELRYMCSTFIDYNLHAYNKEGKLLWQSTWCDCWAGAEKRNEAGQLLACHCRDICANPSPDEPALRTLHVDLDAMQDEVFSLIISSQNYSGVCPDSVSVAVRECHHPDFNDLKGGHQPENHDCNGKVLIACSLTTVLRRGGTAAYGCLYRDFDMNDWMFRNILDHSLEGESSVGSEISKVLQKIFTSVFNQSALASMVNPSRSACIRLCQLYQATKTNPVSKIVVVGIPRGTNEPKAVIAPLTGNFFSDLTTLIEMRKGMLDRAVDPDTVFRLAQHAAGATSGVGAFIRVGNNAFFPKNAFEEARKHNPSMKYACLDMAGHLFRVLDELPPGNVYLPGASEAVLGVLSSSLSGSGDLVSHVAQYGRPVKAHEAQPVEPEQ